MRVDVPSKYDGTYYSKAFEWNGLHVLAPESVQDVSLNTVAETIFNLLRYRPDLLQLLADGNTRFSILPEGGVVTDTPEFKYLDGVNGGDGRPYNTLPAVGGPITGGYAAANIEANVLSLPSDPFQGLENISLHEWAHVIHLGAINKVPELQAELQAAWDNAKATGLWNATYAGSTIEEYFAVTSAAFFDFKRGAGPAFNDVNTRAELEAYDPQLFAFLVKIYGNDTWRDGDWSGSADSDTLIGLNTSDLIFGNDGDDLIVGGEGNDSAYGGTGNDQIFAGADDVGDDRFFGEAGSDTLGGGNGQDLVVGGDGSDIIFGGYGSDSLYGGDWVRPIWPEDGQSISNDLGDTIWAGVGNDLVFGGDGSDTLGGGSGNDTLWGNNGNNLFFGGKDDEPFAANQDGFIGGVGNDTMYGGTDNDNLAGWKGDDLLFGGDDNDLLFGGEGNDVIWTGQGDDSISGDIGADKFGFVRGDGSNTIYDFEFGVDLIDLSAYVGASSLAALVIANVDGGIRITLPGDDAIVLLNVNGAALAETDFLFASV